VETGEDVSVAEYVALVDELEGLQVPVADLVGGEASPAAVASAVELILEGLHLSKRLNKDAVGGRAQYRSRG
jgi:magnesium chelatase subunit I